MADDTPADPVTPLIANAAIQHEMYQAWQTAGFSEERAFDLLKTWLAAYTASTAGG